MSKTENDTYNLNTCFCRDSFNMWAGLRSLVKLTDYDRCF